jgi:hypothetical protein
MKVALEIRTDGWTWTVYNSDGSVLATTTMKRDKGGYRSTKKAVVFEKAMEEYPKLLEAIEDENVMDIAEELEYWEGDGD